MPETHPTDVLTADLLDTYAAGVRRLESIVAAGLRRGLDERRLGTIGQRAGDATHAYRQRQLEQARAVLRELEELGERAGPLIITAAYRSGLVANDRELARHRDLGRIGATQTYGRVHVRAVAELAGSMSASLRDAAAQAAVNVATVFERADALEGALPPSGRVAGVRFIGRRLDDPYRKLALETVAGGLVALDTRRQVSAELARRLIMDGVTDAVTGFVDRSGRRWPLDKYAAMVARTTTREAVTAATTNRLRELGVDLVTVSTHAHPADECTPYEGRTFSLDGRTPGYDRLDVRPPFHPNCAHVLVAADADLDAYEAELRAATQQRAAPATQPAPPPARPRYVDEPSHAPVADLIAPSTPPSRPFPGHRVEYGPETDARLEAQRIANVVTEDPGREPGLDEDFYAQAATDERRRVRALNRAMGPDLVKELKRSWARDERIRERLLNGELTIADVEELAADEAERRYRQEQERELLQRPKVHPTPCFHCGRLKSRASDVCNFCGDDPVGGLDAGDAMDYGYNGGGTRVEGAGLREARRRFDVDFYGVDPDDPNADYRGPAIGGVSRSRDAFAKGARRRRAMGGR